LSGGVFYFEPPGTAQAIRLLNICDEYGKKFSITFNAAKSGWLYVTKRIVCVPQFYDGSNHISRVSQYTYLGHIVSENLDDKCKILRQCNSLCGKIN